MKRPGLDPETAERMLHGERIGPPVFAELLAAVAVAAEPAAEALAGEEAAVAAFHHARRLPAAPVRTRRSTSASLRATVVGLLLLLLAGGVTMVAASHRLPGSPGGKHSPPARNPATSGTLQRAPSPVPERPEPSRSPGTQPGHHTPTPHGTHSTKSPGPATSGLPILPTAPKLPKPTKPAKGKVSKAPGVKIPSPKVAVTGSGGPTL